MTLSQTLSYPLKVEPKVGDGSTVAIAPGVLWLRMPLGGGATLDQRVGAFRCRGLTIVDTGIRSPATIEAWEAAISGELANSPVSRVIVTHMHPDHCGTAAWFVERFKVRLWMSRLEYLTCRLMADDTGRDVPSDAIDFYRAAGWDSLAIDDYKAKFGGFGKMLYPLPASYRRLSDGDTLQIGASEWVVVVGNGHSPEHVCLHCPELKLLISGDQVLPKISSNVSVHPTEPDADPLSDWLDSLARIKSRVPDDVLVLPAHNSPFRGLHARADGLIESHQRGLTAVAGNAVAAAARRRCFRRTVRATDHRRAASYGHRGGSCPSQLPDAARPRCSRDRP